MKHLVLFLVCVASTLLLPHSAASIPATTEEECELPEGATILVEGKKLSISESNFQLHHSVYPPIGNSGYGNDAIKYFVLNEKKPVLYVKNFLNNSLSDELKDFCISGQRFKRSPIRGFGDNPSVASNDVRTSESCTMIPASVYRTNPQFMAMRQEDPVKPQVERLGREVDVSWDIALRASNLLRMDPNLVEALQVVRYTTPDAEYKLHHDHGGFYGKQTEHRPWTMLIFLNNVDAGGHTVFPELGIEVVPRAGDALIWSNTNEDGSVDPDMVHMGKPPSGEGIEKYAVNVWFGDATLESRQREGGQW